MPLQSVNCTLSLNRRNTIIQTEISVVNDEMIKQKPNTLTHTHTQSANCRKFLNCTIFVETGSSYCCCSVILWKTFDIRAQVNSPFRQWNYTFGLKVAILLLILLSSSSSNKMESSWEWAKNDETFPFNVSSIEPNSGKTNCHFTWGTKQAFAHTSWKKKLWLLFIFFFFIFICCECTLTSVKSQNFALKTCSHINFLTSVQFFSHFHLSHKSSHSSHLPLNSSLCSVSEWFPSHLTCTRDSNIVLVSILSAIH